MHFFRAASKPRLVRVALVAIAFAVASCGKSPSQPSPPLERPPSGPIIVIAVAIAGPKTVAPGATAQFTLMARLSNQTEEDVTNEAVWTSNNRSLSIDRGLATGQFAGEATIQARLTRQGQAAFERTLGVMVLPQGTFRVIGRVTEPGGVPVPFATVSVTSGTGRGLQSFTADDGGFRLYGVAGEARLSAGKTGYSNVSPFILVTEQDQQVELELTPLTPIDEVEGLYTLTVAASASCREALLEEARMRTYPATVTRKGRDLVVTLVGSFFGSNNHFIGRLEPGGTAVFPFGYAYYTYGPGGPAIVEQLGVNRFRIRGTATARLGAEGFSGDLNGELHHQLGAGPSMVCSAKDHQFRLVRR